MQGDKAMKDLADSKDPKVVAILKNPKQYAELIRYHVVPGATLPAARLFGIVQSKDGLMPFATLEGARVNATIVDGTVNVSALRKLSV